MAKKATKTVPLEGELEQPKKKGLFSFLRRKNKKSKEKSTDKPDVAAEDDAASVDVPDGQKTGKKATRKPAAKIKTATSKKPAAKKSPAKKPAPKKPVAKKSTEKTKKVTSDPKTLALDTLDGEDEAPKKRKLFGFLKRKKKKSDTEELLVAEYAETEDEAEKPKKKGLFSFLKRKKKEKIGSENSSSKLDEQVSISNDSDDHDAPKKGKFGFLTKKMIIILISAFSATAATGAAAVVFAGPMLLGKELSGLACEVAYETDFELMKENRVVSFIRADAMPPKSRVLLLMKYTKYLVEQYPDSQLVTVSVLDTEGPTERPQFRGANIGAQVVYAPDPLLTQATKQDWEVRYINADYAYSGKFIGDRYELSPEEIALIESEILKPEGCHVPEVELSDEELAEIEQLEAEAAALAEQQEAAMEAEAAALEAEAEMHAEPGFVDNMLTMVGLGGSGDPEIVEELNADKSNTYPGDKNVMPEIVHEEERGLIGGILHMVGLGGAEESASEQHDVDVFGTKIRYD